MFITKKGFEKKFVNLNDLEQKTTKRMADLIIEDGLMTNEMKIVTAGLILFSDLN